MISKNQQLLMLLTLTIALNFSSTTLAQDTSTDSLQLNLSPYPYLEITSEQQLQSVAQSEGWSGSGNFDDPFIIENYLFEGDEPQSSVASKIASNPSPPNPLGFDRISLVLTNIDSYLILRNNQFAHSVIVNTTQAYRPDNQIVFESNRWISSDDPNNLMIYGFGGHILKNTFDGSLMRCEDIIGTDYYSRIFIRGSGTIIEKNKFEVDQGCTPLADISINEPINGPNNYVHNVTVENNYFKSIDVALNLKRGSVFIQRNDFDTGEFAIFISVGFNGQKDRVYENNFRVSTIGQIGQQFYNGTSYFVTYTRSQHLGTSGDVDVRNNYYSVWNGPDSNHDGIVDNPLIEGDIIGYTPSKTPFPTYYFPANQETPQWQKYSLVGVILITVSGLSYFYVVPWLSRQRKIYNGTMVGNTKAIITDLFASQTILYYTLIGQSKIDNKEVEEKIAEAIPQEIYDFKYLLHPVRMSIIKLLYENLEMTSIEMKEIMRVSWNDYSTHSLSLKKRGYINVEEGFVDGKRRQLLTILPKGTAEFKMLMDLMHLFFDNSVDYAAYIKTAQEKLDTTDPDLYPDS